MYCIFNKKRNMYCRWDEAVILFDTKEECYSFMNAIPSFFDDEMEYIDIQPFDKEMEKDIYVIKYSELDKSSFPKENTIIKHGKHMKEVLKNG